MTQSGSLPSATRQKLHTAAPPSHYPSIISTSSLHHLYFWSYWTSPGIPSFLFSSIQFVGFSAKRMDAKRFSSADGNDSEVEDDMSSDSDSLPHLLLHLNEPFFQTSPSRLSPERLVNEKENDAEVQIYVVAVPPALLLRAAPDQESQHDSPNQNAENKLDRAYLRPDEAAGTAATTVLRWQRSTSNRCTLPPGSRAVA
ncbi:hypothetical protein TWF696_007755 [Orbilia brochopaga]|uniref:Uncharacterized protein n=1 Tax=Orbilia brochopaga TaxID=3140254 RepID=A0AAV9UL27_9PEZI